MEHPNPNEHTIRGHLVGNEEGWMTDVEVAVLVGFARILPYGMGQVLEIGCWKGRTTSGLALVGGVEVVDTFLGSPDMPAEIRGRSVFEEFRANMVRLDLLDRITIRDGPSREVLPTLEQASYRLIVIDASHEKADVLFDLKEAWRLCCSEGYIFVDDINWPVVQEATKEFVLSKRIRTLNLATSKLAYIRRP